MLYSKQRITNMRKHGFLSALMVVALAACGGSEDAFQGGGGNGGGPAPQVESVTLASNSATIPSEGLVPAEITAYVRDSNNQFMANVPVTFSANSGGLLVTQAVTDANGVAKATLSSAGDPTSRSITVTAAAGTESATINVNVAGSSLTLQGPPVLTLNQQGTYRVALVDSANRPIVGRTITVASARSNTLSAPTVTTDSTGGATFTLTAVNSGNDTVTIGGLGLTATQAIGVSSDSFTFTTPTAGTEVGLSPATQSVSVTWLVNGSPVVGQPVSFSTTRGTVGAATVNTNASGVASTTVTANSAGGAVVTALGGSSSTSVALEFVAATPSAVDLQPSLFAIGPTQSSTLTATVRDAAGNLVKNKTVVFTLMDVTGGTLSVGAATTNSQGKAQTVYTAGTVTSASNGVLITATVQGTAIATQVGLTVSRREVFLSLGSGNEISEPNTAQYSVEYIIQLTDANGNGVAGVPVSLKVLSERYYKGTRVAGLTTWGTAYSTPLGCADEDIDRDGILDRSPLDEDFNGSGRIEAGNIASVAPANGVTDANGFLLARVYYPQEYAFYLTVALSASATVSGTEYVRTNSFMLGGSADDFGNLLVGPPGSSSPFGVAGSCLNPN